jgi:hypothetical protein
MHKYYHFLPLFLLDSLERALDFDLLLDLEADLSCFGYY